MSDLTTSNLSSTRQEVAFIDTSVADYQSLTEDGDILLYGCNVAATETGVDFIGKLAQATSADIAASDDLTGASTKGGDWELEAQTSNINPASIDVSLWENVLMGRPELIGSNPRDDEVLANDTDRIILRFSEEMIGFGRDAYIKIYRDDHTLVTRLDFDGLDLFIGPGGSAFMCCDLININLQSPLDSDGYYVHFFNNNAINGVVSGLPAVSFTDSTTLNFTIGPVNTAPTVSNVPADITVTEDTASNVDLSAVTFADADGDDLTVTLSVSRGSFSTPADGAEVGSGVTEKLVNSYTITLVGSAADINTYLETASNIQYTGAENASGEDAATITISATDGNGGNLSSNPTVNLDITDVTSATSTGAGFNTSNGTNLTPYITTDSSNETIIIAAQGHEVGSIADGQDGTDTLSVVTGVNLSNMTTLQNFENLTLANDATVTIAASQLAQFTGTITAAGVETMNVNGDGNFSTLANIESFVAGDDSTNSRTITVAQSNTNVTATSSSDAVTFNIGALTYTGSLTGEGTVDDTLQMADGSSVSGATLTNIENLTLDNGASVTMTAAQHNNFSTITAAGTEQITISASLANITGNAAIETYVLNQDTTFTLDAA